MQSVNIQQRPVVLSHSLKGAHRNVCAIPIHPAPRYEPYFQRLPSHHLPLRTSPLQHNQRSPQRDVATPALARSDDQDRRNPFSAVAERFGSLFNVYSDPRCNAKLLALAVGQMMCSVATLIHDSYLPVYVHDELGLSSTKASGSPGRQISQLTSPCPCMGCVWVHGRWPGTCTTWHSMHMASKSI